MTIQSYIAAVRERAERAKPFEQLSLLQEEWLEWRGPNGEKYTIAEFDNAHEQEFDYFARRDIPLLCSLLERAVEVVEAASVIKDADGSHVPETSPDWDGHYKTLYDALSAFDAIAGEVVKEQP